MKQLPYIQTSTAIIGYSDSAIAKNERNDCFVRAVASSFDCSYDTAHSWVKEKFQRVNRKGTMNVVSKMRKMCDDKERFVDKSVKSIEGLSEIVYKFIPMNGICRPKPRIKRTTLNQFIKKYPTGVYLLIVKGHAFTLKNGAVIGNEQDSKSIKKNIYNAFEIC
jgi:hypothetical protein